MEGDVAARYLAKALESLESAKSEFDAGRYNSCANRCYYACFQAAIAALTLEGMQPRGRWSHESVQAQFAGQLINRRKRFGADLGRTLADNRTLRGQADYTTRLVTDVQAGRALKKADEFVTTVQRGVQRSDER